MEEQAKKLISLLSEMDVPQMRIHDVRWLYRNLAVRNGGHKNFTEAKELLKTFVKIGNLSDYIIVEEEN